MAVFSDTTNKNGLIQRFEFLTGLGDAAVSGDSTKLKIVTAIFNAAFDEIMPFLLSYSDHIRWDDINHPDLPIGRVNLTSGQADYSITVDDNSLDILNFTDLWILTTSSGTEYSRLKRIYLDDPLAAEAMSPNPSVSGVPEYWLENNNVIFLYPEPNYSATNGIKIFFERQQDYFASSDTTAEPGIPIIFHDLLALIASHEWVFANKDDPKLLTRLEAKIAQKKKDLRNLISTRNPTKNVMTVKSIDAGISGTRNMRFYG